MKKYILSILAITGSSLFISCEKDDHDECHSCHLELQMADGTIDHDYQIGEFCGEDLHDIEENGYVAAEAFSHEGENFDAGTYTNVHCEEHADHDDHDDHDH